MKRETALIKNTFILGFGTFFPKAAGLITLPIITGELSKMEYGTYDLLVVLVSLILPIATLQIQAAAFRFLIDCRDDKEKTKSVISTIIIFTLITSVLPLIIIFAVLGKYSVYMRLAIMLYFLSDILLHTTQQIVRGLGYNSLHTAGTVVVSVINLLLVFVFLKICGMSLLGVILSLFAANMCGTIIMLAKISVFSYIRSKYFSFAQLKEMLKYSLPMIPNNFSSWVMTLSDRLLLVAFMGAGVNAVYAVAKKIPNLIDSVQSAFSLAWIENASIAAGDGDSDEYYSKTFDSYFRIVTGAAAVLIGFAPLLFSILIRGDYGEALLQMPVLFIAAVFSALASYMSGIYIADMRTRSIGITTTAAALVNIIIDLLFIKKVGMWAASASTLISYALLFFFRMNDIKKFRKIRYNYAGIIFSFLFLIAMSFALYNEINIVLTAAAGLIFAAVFNYKIAKSFACMLLYRLRSGEK